MSRRQHGQFLIPVNALTHATAILLSSSANTAHHLTVKIHIPMGCNIFQNFFNTIIKLNIQTTSPTLNPLRVLTNVALNLANLLIAHIRRVILDTRELLNNSRSVHVTADVDGGPEAVQEPISQC